MLDVFNLWLHITGFEPENAKPNVQTHSVPNEIDFKVTVMSNEDTFGSTKVSEIDRSSQLNLEVTEPYLSDINFTSVIIPNDKLTAQKKSEAGSNSVHSQPKKGSEYAYLALLHVLSMNN